MTATAYRLLPGVDHAIREYRGETLRPLCGEVKPFSAFTKNNKGSFGLNGRCRECRNRPQFDPATDITGMTKRCSMCQETLPLEEFAKDMRSRDGRYYRCRRCLSKGDPHAHDERRALYLEGKKRCAMCGQIKVFATFPPSRYGPASFKEVRFKDGCESTCTECVNAKKRARRQADPEKALRESRESHMRHREEDRARSLKYMQAHREERIQYELRRIVENSDWRRAICRKWSRNHPDRVREKARKWRNAHKGLVIIHSQAARARRAKVGGLFTAKEWEALKAKYGYRCLRCGRHEPNIKLTIDHIIPISKKGPHTAENIQPLCFSCNCAKGNRVIIDYRPKGDASEKKRLYVQMTLF